MVQLTSKDYAIAKSNGISPDLLCARVNRLVGWTVEEAVSTPLYTQRNGKPTLFTKEQLKIAKSNGIDRQTLYARVHRSKWDLEKAMTHPIAEKTPRGKEKDIIRYRTKNKIWRD